MSVATLDRAQVERLVREALTKRFSSVAARPSTGAVPKLVVNISARHCHVTQEDLERLFGKGHQLHVHKALYQDGFFAAEEAVTIIGPRHRMIPNLRILGPLREKSQIELAFTDAISLGLDNVPVRLSGNVKDTPGAWIMGPKGMIQLKQGIIRAAIHVHMNPEDADIRWDVLVLQDVGATRFDVIGGDHRHRRRL